MQPQPIQPERLRSLFHPESIALIGATDNSSWSINTFQNLKNFEFQGTVYCVNPNRDIVHGQKAFRSIAELPQTVDLAYVMVSTQQVCQIVQEAGAAGIRNLVILTAGFSEMGEEGKRIEKQLLELANGYDMTLLGPNGNGFVNVTSQITPYGLPLSLPLKSGPVGVVLQSGGLASAIVTLAQARNIGLSFLVSMGNEAMISATDVVDYLIEDDTTRVIALFLESIRDPAQFKRVAKKALRRGKPIVALKIGKSDESARTAMAHTGALVGDHSVNEAVLNQLGIISVDSLEDLLITAGLLGYYPALGGPRMAVVTPSGGACDILSDRAQEEHIQLPDFADATVKGLKSFLPEFATAHNPLDVTGYVVVDRFLMQKALEVVVQDPGFDFVFCLTEPPRLAPPQIEPVIEHYQRLGRIVQQSEKPILVVTNTSVDITEFGRSLCDLSGIHFIGGIQHGMSAIGNAVWWEDRRRRYESSIHHNLAAESIQFNTQSGTWSEFKTRSLLENYGIPLVPGILAASADETVLAARQLGFPVVLKVQSDEILHKSDIGGVLLNIRTEQDARNGFHSIMENVSKLRPDAHVQGLLVTPMRPSGTELLVGVTKDPLWGLVLAVGLGGVFVEVFKDISLRVLPVYKEEILEMLQELKGYALLKGVRGTDSADLEELANVIDRIAALAYSLQEHLETIEINPLWVKGSKIEALDCLVTWK